MGSDDRVLVPVTYGFSVRYLLPTGLLDALAEVCTPVVALGWDDPALEAELDRRGVEVVRLPPAELSDAYRAHRRALAPIHEARLASPTSAIRRRQDLSGYSPRGRAIARTRLALAVVARLRPGATAAIEAAEAGVIREGTNVADFDALVGRTRADSVLSFTPYHEQDALLLWAARDRGLPTTSTIISFDNPTTRRRLVVRSDQVLVWNATNAEQLLRAYPDLDPDAVSVVGAPQFDLHRRADLVADDATWRAELGLPADRPVVLYGAGPGWQLPGEPRLVAAIDRAISEGRIPGDPFLLVRPHPIEVPETWRDVGASLRNGVVAPSWGGADVLTAWPSDEDLTRQLSSLAHSAVHVNICSSMSIDGAMYDRPQVSPTSLPDVDAELDRRLLDAYRQEHWQPLARSGGLDAVAGTAGVVAAIGRGLVDPGARAAGRRRLLTDLLTFTDGRSSARVAAAIDHPTPASSTS